MDSRLRIEEKIGKPVLYFCYPYGCSNERVEKEVKSTGYLGAVVCGGKVNFEDEDPYAIKRMLILNSTTLNEFKNYATEQRMEKGKFYHSFNFMGNSYLYQFFSNSFVWDDESLILANPYIRSIKHLPTIFTKDIFHHMLFSPSHFYRPLQTLSYLFDYSIYRYNPFGYHLTNFLLHLFNCIIIFFLIDFLFENKSKVLSGITSILFLIHPLQTQAVTYISGRADPLMVFFFLSSFFLFVKYLRKERKYYYFFSILLFILSLLSKEAAITLPFVLLVYTLIFSKKKFPVSLLPFFVILLGYLFLRLHLYPAPYSTKASFYIRGLTMSKVFADYIRMFFLPIGLHMGRMPDIAKSLWQPKFFLSLIFSILFLIFFIKSFKISKVLFFSLSWFLLNLLPVSNLIFPLNAIMAEHWLYLPSIGFFLTISYGMSKLIQKNAIVKDFALSCFFIILIVFSFLTVKRNKDWKDSLTIYQNVLHYSPEHTNCINNIALIYVEKGNYKKAEEEYKRGLKVRPRKELYTNLGVLYEKTKRYEEAKECYIRALSINPDYVSALNNLGTLYAKEKKYQKCLTLYKKVLRLCPEYPEVHYNLAVFCVSFKPRRLDLARKECQIALKLGYQVPEEFLKYLQELELKSQKD